MWTLDYKRQLLQCNSRGQMEPSAESCSKTEAVNRTAVIRKDYSKTCISLVRTSERRPAQWLSDILIFLTFLSTVTSGAIYTNQFAVEVPSGLADEVAQRNGFINKGQIGNLKGFFLFEHNRVQKRSIDYSHSHHRTLKTDPEVHWVEQQRVKRRIKRDGSSDSSRETRSPVRFPDPLFSEQWYLNNGAFGSFDMNVGPAWEQGYTGKGIVVTILDDGIQSNHPDLIQNYDPKASTDINGQDDDPMPQDNGDNKHGTRCAGEVAATAFNDFCGVGVAYNASIGGVRMLDGTVTDEVEARALSLNPSHIHIYSASWGPEDDGKTVDGPGRLAKRAFIDGIQGGRGGLGSIFVWASGNGGRHQDNCNCDGYTNSIYTLSISSATQAGGKPWYLEECSSTLATTYSSGTPHRDGNVVTVDMDTSYFRDLQKHRTANPAVLCTRSHTGTSASAPIAAAISALALEANPQLTWRDMQHLVVLTSRPDPLSREDGWVTNGVGRKVSHKFGYGLMDAGVMVKYAEHWQTVPQQRICHTPADKQERLISNQFGERLEVSMVTNGCQGSGDNRINFLEHVQVLISLQFLPRGNLHIILVSPSGTPSSVLLPRPFDTQESNFNNWPFLSVHFWGENPSGQWKLIISNEGRHRVLLPGKLKEWSLIFYGTEQNPISFIPNGVNRNRHPGSFVRETSNLIENPCVAAGKYQYLEQSEECLDRCPDGYYGDNRRICQPCSDRCNKCFGPGQDHCSSCPTLKYLYQDTCLNSCPEAFYADQEIDDCLPCSSLCKTCENSGDLCITCASGLYLHQQQCLNNCPRHTYPTEDFRCNTCHPSCASCKGPRLDDCLTCPTSSFHLNGTCRTQCPDGSFSDLASRRCLKCDRGCKFCQKRNQCTTCYKGWSSSNGLCVYDTPCSNGYYSNGKTCLACDISCTQCSGGDPYSCTACSPNRYLHQGRCMTACPSGTYLSPDQGPVCLSCPVGCSLCSNYDHCQECQSHLVLHLDHCITSCPNGFYQDKEKNTCVQCDVSCGSCVGSTSSSCNSCNYGFYLLEGSCLKSCPEEYYARPSSRHAECQKCHHLCKSCSGPGQNSCTSCHYNYALIGGVCLQCLLNEYYDTKAKACQPCHSNCAQCEGPTNRDCTSCSTQLRLQPELKACLPCCQGTTALTTSPDVLPQCCPCTSDPELCGGFSDKIRSVTSSSDTHQHKAPLRGKIQKDEIIIPMNDVVPVVVGICASAVVLFFIMFGVLQAMSSGLCRNSVLPNYRRVPLARYDGNSEKVALTHEEENEEEEDNLFEKT